MSTTAEAPAQPLALTRPKARPGATTDPHHLAQRYLDRHARQAGRYTLHFWKGDFWRWTGRCYERLDESEFRATLNQFVRRDFDKYATTDAKGRRAHVTSSRVTNVQRALEGIVLLPSSKDQPFGIGRMEHVTDLLALNNGLLDLREFVASGTATLRAHTPEWFSCAALPFDFDVTAGCPRWEEFIAWMCVNDQARIHLLQEWFGYCLTSDTSFHKFLMLVGSGRNGKSVLMRILRALLGEHNVAALGPEAFRGRFGLEALIGKLANICGDVDIAGLDEGRLKALTGEDTITVDRKYRNSITFKCIAKFTFATNNPPRIADRSEGIWRRLLLFPCEATVAEDKVDPCLTERLTEELPGILNWAVAGLRRLSDQGHFTEAAAVTAKGEELRDESDPARRFLRENCVADPSAAVLTKQLQDEAKGWAHLNGLPEIRVTDLGRAVKALYGIDKQKRLATLDQNRPWEYRGIRLSDERDQPLAGVGQAVSGAPGQ